MKTAHWKGGEPVVNRPSGEFAYLHWRFGYTINSVVHTEKHLQEVGKMKGKNLLTLVLFFSLISYCIFLIAMPSTFAKEPVGEELRIGVTNIFSGPGAPWGLASKYASLARANMINREGGLLVGGIRHPLKLFFEDTRMDSKVARAAAEKLINRDKVKYIIGPGTTPENVALQTISGPAKVINIGYSYTKSVFSPEYPYSISGMILPEQVVPHMIQDMIDKYKVKKVSLICKNYVGGLNTRQACAEAWTRFSVEVISQQTYEPGTTDFFPIMNKLVQGNPDVIDLTVPTAGEAAQLCKSARQLGYKGVLSMVAAADVVTFNEIGGKYVDGLICLASAAAMPQYRTEFTEEFMKEYTKGGIEWNDEAGYKVYAFEMLCETIKTAGPAALNDTDAFRVAMPKVRYKDRYIKGYDITITYVGKSVFGHSQQIGLPIAIVQVADGGLKLLKVSQVKD